MLASGVSVYLRCLFESVERKVDCMFWFVSWPDVTKFPNKGMLKGVAGTVYKATRNETCGVGDDRSFSLGNIGDFISGCPDNPVQSIPR